MDHRDDPTHPHRTLAAAPAAAAEPGVASERDAAVQPLEDPSAIAPRLLAGLQRFHAAMIPDRSPGDPPRSEPYLRAMYAARARIADLGSRTWWTGKDAPGEAATDVRGVATATFTRRPDNRHILATEIGVAPAHRRRGLGTALLRTLAREARADGRTTLLGSVLSVEGAPEPAGAAFAHAFGAEPGLAAHVNRLLLERLDREQLQRWVAEGERRAPEVSLLALDGDYPEELLDPIARIFTAMHSAPHGTLPVEPALLTPAMLRDRSRALLERGFRRWSLFARRRDDGELVGATLVLAEPETEHYLVQDDTVVLPAWRGRGIAKWLKAAMALRLAREVPAARELRTGNADANAPMLAINLRMGYEPWLVETVWQVALDTLDDRLTRAAPHR